MRWIQKDKGRIKRGTTDIPEGDAFFVDENGSKAIVNGKLYIDGKEAPMGEHKIRVGNKELPVSVGQRGRASRGKPIDVGGGNLGNRSKATKA